jgi:hypothetical protein
MEGKQHQKADKKDWIECWEQNLSQERIQEWTKMVTMHIQEIIRVDGSNEYKESKGGRRRNADRVH